MSRLPSFALLSALAVLTTACATPSAGDADRSDRVYRTGSNLPVRDPNALSDVRTVDPSSLDKFNRSGMPGTAKAN